MAEQWIVIPKVEGSTPSSYPMNVFKFFFFTCFFFTNLSLLSRKYLIFFLFKTSFLTNYYFLNDLIWQEGLLVDFLQKKISNDWTRKFLIHASYFFNEKIIFDRIIRFYIDLFIWPAHKLFIFEFNNVAQMLFINLFFFFMFVFLMFYFYLLLLMF